MPIIKKNIRLQNDHILKGPAYAESLLQNDGVKSDNPLDKYIQFIQILENSKSSDFFLGHFNLQAAIHAADKAQSASLLTAALQHFQGFLRKGKRKTEAYYYALWQIVQIMHALDYPWPQVEDIYLQAYETLPSRGETIEALTRYYIATGQWAIAYIYSSFAKDNFFGRPPQLTAWGLNPAFYNWQVLDMHTAVCFQLGLEQEARETFGAIYTRTRQEPTLFEPEEIEWIQSKVELIQEPILS